MNRRILKKRAKRFMDSFTREKIPAAFTSKEERRQYVIASWGGGWEHVSVSLARRCPTWEEMCMVKDIFWGEEECVVQFHPPRSEYVNRHPYCLHLWKKIGEEYETPPKEYVG